MAFTLPQFTLTLLKISLHSPMYNHSACLAGVAQWIECRPVNRQIAGSIPSQGMCLSCGPGPQLGTCERQRIGTPMFLSVSFSLPSSL